MITVYTANVGGYDTLLPPLVVNDSCRYVCYTDSPDGVPSQWETRYISKEIHCLPDEPYSIPRLARIPKLLSHRFGGVDYSIWHDANFQLAADPEALIRKYLATSDIAVFRHPKRHSLWAEGETLITNKFPRPQPIREQLRRYRAIGYPRATKAPAAWKALRYGDDLYACGVILRRHTHSICKLNEWWWSEVCKGSERDQLSFPFVLWRCKVRPAVIPGLVFKSPEFVYHRHNPPKAKEQCQSQS